VLVEYSPVEIGGRSYICPVKSVSIYTATETVTKWAGTVNSGMMFQQIVGIPKVTAINDVVFDHYHLFRSEIRILPPEGGESPQ
jgi:hypothetical protein